MNAKLLLTLGLLSSIGHAKNFECSQGDGDARYDFKYVGTQKYSKSTGHEKGKFVLIYTEDDESKVIGTFAAKFFPKARIISAGRFLAKLNKDLRFDSTLYKYNGSEKVILTEILECSETKDRSFKTWKNELME